MPHFLYLITGLLAGGLIVFLLYRIISVKKLGELSTRLKVEEEKQNFKQEQILQLNDMLREREKDLSETRLDNANLSSENKHLLAKLEEHKKEVDKIQEKFKIEFRNLANDILEEKTKKFTIQNREKLDEILLPLSEKLKDFEKKVETTYEKGLKDQTDLKTELKRLHELNIKLDEDARNLTNALKSDSKKQGNWGEIVLERVLERSGLVKGEEYFIQPAVRNDRGELLRPDVIINLPDKKHLIVDSKVSLTAYESFSNCDDDKKRNDFLKQHISSIKNHIKNLSEKNYQFAETIDSPDFVLLFMPVEPAFSLAVQNETDLFAFAWERKIVIVSPTTLLATLRTVASIWKHEKQTQNALEIARQGGALYDKFVSFLIDLEKLGNQLDTVKRTYDDVHKKISSGTGNLIRRSQNLKDLGAKTSKKLPDSFSYENEE